ncbi:hypothetical protein ACH5RR_023004 [Cinchona calisaya]|uniref:Uncharacterized protein n=1 Tax=Cinchona calisaya TaxID=153742 RepID=A0ABD2Z9F2_9GENT
MTLKRKRGPAAARKRKLWKHAEFEEELGPFLERQFSKEGAFEEEVFKSIPREVEILEEFLALLNGLLETDFKELEKIVDREDDNMDYDKAESGILRIESIFRGIGAKKLCYRVFLCLAGLDRKGPSIWCLANVESLERELNLYKKVFEQLIGLEKKIMETEGQKLRQPKQHQEAASQTRRQQRKRKSSSISKGKKEVVTTKGEGQGGKGAEESYSEPEEDDEAVVIYDLPYRFHASYKKLKEENEKYYKPYAEYCRNMVREGLVNKVFCKTMEMRAHKRQYEYRAKFIDENIQHIEEKMTELQNVLLEKMDTDAEHDQCLCLVNRLYLMSAGLGLGNVKSDCDHLRYLIKSKDLTGSQQQFQLLKEDFQAFKMSYIAMIKMEKDMEDNDVFVPMWPENGVWKIPKIGRMMTITNHPHDVFDEE